MKTINVTQSFKFAVQGIRVIEIASGVQSVDDECAAVAIEAGWATEVDEHKPARRANKAHAATPEAK